MASSSYATHFWWKILHTASKREFAETHQTGDLHYPGPRGRGRMLHWIYISGMLFNNVVNIFEAREDYVQYQYQNETMCTLIPSFELSHFLQPAQPFLPLLHILSAACAIPRPLPLPPWEGIRFPAVARSPSQQHRMLQTRSLGCRVGQSGGPFTS